MNGLHTGKLKHNHRSRIVIAFEDCNGNLRYDEGEPAGGFRNYAPQEPMRTDDSEQRQLRNANIVLKKGAPPPGEFAALRAPEGEQRDLHAGTISRLDRPRFGPVAGDLGVWQPIDFVFTYGAGIFFLQPYDPNKIPVLFVHGLGGYAQEFTTMIDRLPDGFDSTLIDADSVLLTRLGRPGDPAEVAIFEIGERRLLATPWRYVGLGHQDGRVEWRTVVRVGSQWATFLPDAGTVAALRSDPRARMPLRVLGADGTSRDLADPCPRASTAHYLGRVPGAVLAYCGLDLVAVR